MNEWIRYSDREPPKSDTILAFCECDDVVTMYFEKDIEKWVANCGCSGWEHERGNLKVTHWMPLPGPPRG
jgi:hypothetical protein